MVMNYKEVPNGISEKDGATYSTGIGLVNDFAESLREKGLLPEKFSKATPASDVASAIEKLAPKAPFEIPAVSEALYNKTREILTKEGFTLVTAIKPVSIETLTEDPGTAPFFGYINSSQEMRANVPLDMEVAIDPKHFRIKHSNNKSTDVQIEMIEKEEAILKSRIPEEVRDVISMIMPQQASILAQLDLAYQEKTRKVLFTDWLGRTDDQTVPGLVALVGRAGPSSGLHVRDWDRGSGGGNVFAVSVVVLPRKLAVQNIGSLLMVVLPKETPKA